MTDQDRAGLSTDEMAKAVASLISADTIRSPFGDLRFFDGVPLPETKATAYDALDLESNRVETIPGKSWFPFVRIYGPLEPWVGQTWRLDEFDPINQEDPSV